MNPDRSDRLRGKRILITGASSGIGAATALRVAADGADVGLLDTADGSAVERDCRAFGRRASFRTCDVSDESSVRTGVSVMVDSLGGLDVVLHVAGIVRDRRVPIDELELSDWQQVQDVNLTGGFLLAKHATPHLEHSAGVLVLTGSGAGVWNSHPSVAYGASKAGLHGLFMVLEEPLRARGIRVHLLAPGAVDTPMIQPHRADRALVDRSAAPAKSLVDPADVAAVLAFLASDDARAVRGSIRTW